MIKSLVNSKRLGSTLVWCLITLFFLLLVRFFTALTWSESGNFSDIFLRGLGDDLVWISPGFLVALLLIYFVSRWSETSSSFFGAYLLASYLILEVLLTAYFGIARTPLTYQSTVNISAEQISEVVEIYEFSPLHLFWLVPMIVICSWLILRIRKLFLQLPYYQWSGMIFLIMVFWAYWLPVDRQQFASEYNYFSARNKVGFFIESYGYYQEEQRWYAETEIAPELQKFFALRGISRKTYNEFPFYATSSLKNPLGPYFQKRDTLPNVVVVICESLGRQFSGPEARLGSFTPFLDSLATQGLYWSNFLANAERTFGALPNLLGGLPEAETGFMNLKEDMPEHHTLPELLKDADGYQTAFFCGARKGFDNMDIFLMTQKFDLIMGKEDFSANGEMREIEDTSGNKKMFNWGAEDQVVFMESLDMLDSSFKVNKPYFSVYLTTSFHEPFAFSNMDQFRLMAQSRIRDLAPENKSEYANNLETFAALIYVDWAVRNFIESYQKRPEFDNTIFIFCGDHSIQSFGNESRLEKFHVPLIIYSPLLSKKGENFEGLSCQKDLADALQALLLYNFHSNISSDPVSIYDGLSTSRSFQSAADFPIMYADRRMEAYIWQNWVLMDDELFRLKDGIKLQRLSDAELKDKMKERLQNYKLVNRYACKNDRILPPDKHPVIAGDRGLRFNWDFDTWQAPSESFMSNGSATTESFCSGTKSWTNGNEKYLNLVKDFELDPASRYRLRVRFNIHAEGSEYPVFVVHLGSGDSGDNQSLYFTHADLEESTFLQSSPKEGWFTFEQGFWLDRVRLSENQKLVLGVFLVSETRSKYYLDDLYFELRKF